MTDSRSIPGSVAPSPPRPFSSVPEVVLERLDGELKMPALLSGGRRELRAHALEMPLGSWTQRARSSPLVSALDGALRRQGELRPLQRRSLEQRPPLADAGRSLGRLGRRRSFTSYSGVRARYGRTTGLRRLNPWRFRRRARVLRGSRLGREPGSRRPSAGPEHSRADARQHEPCHNDPRAFHGTTSLDCARMLTLPP